MKDMVRMFEIQNHKKQNKKEIMGVTKAILVGAAMTLGLAVATSGWLPQEAQAARCLDCDERLANEGSGGEPACIYGVFSCPPWLGGHGQLIIDEGEPPA